MKRIIILLSTILLLGSCTNSYNYDEGVVKSIEQYNAYNNNTNKEYVSTRCKVLMDSDLSFYSYTIWCNCDRNSEIGDTIKLINVTLENRQ